jgi:soluble P-type ATPase
MDDDKMKNDYPDNMQRYAVCQSIYTQEKMAVKKISFDFDETLNTAEGKELAKRLNETGAQLYIISARDNKDGMYEVADELNIPHFRIYALGSNEVKVFKVKDLGINTHYDNNPDVIKQLPGVGKLFTL